MSTDNSPVNRSGTLESTVIWSKKIDCSAQKCLFSLSLRKILNIFPLFFKRKSTIFVSALLSQLLCSFSEPSTIIIKLWILISSAPETGLSIMLRYTYLLFFSPILLPPHKNKTPSVASCCLWNRNYPGTHGPILIIFYFFFLNLPSPSSLSKSNSFSKHVRNIPHLGPSCHFSDCLSASRHVSLDRQDEPDLPNKGFPNSFSCSFSLMWCEEFIFSSLRLPHKLNPMIFCRTGRRVTLFSQVLAQYSEVLRKCMFILFHGLK